MKEVILLGRINLHGKPIGGETAKNQYLVSELSRFCKVIPLDFYKNKTRPWIFPQTVLTLLLHPKASLILSTTASNVYLLMKFFKLVRSKRNIIHWVVGGEFDKLVAQGKYDVDVLNNVHWNLAQSVQMVDALKECGVKNAMYVRNFKKIAYYPPQKEKYDSDSTVVKFVYVSRIMKEKGVGYLMDAVRILNESGFADRFTLDLYGKMNAAYEDEFNKAIAALPNARYHGMLDLKSDAGYDELSEKHVMLFPTYHPSEGIAGVIIDAYIAGIPVIASDWNHNKEIVVDGVTGLLIPPKNLDALIQKMKDVIEKKVNLKKLADGARAEACLYDAEKVITKDYLNKLGLTE